jgi:LPXTG-site transpeptidase (sortase) family protein
VQSNPPVLRASQTQQQIAARYPYSAKDNSLQIVRIGVDTPVVIGQSTNAAVIADQLDDGAVYYPGSVLPGETGQIVILGHSSPPNWPRIKHDYIFSDIESLNIGDQIILTFNNRQYTYKVIGESIIKPGQEPAPMGSGKANILTLISCWPPGKDYQRIAVSAELIPI